MAYVMIVDDDEDLALAISKVLGDASHETRIELETGPALASMKLRTPDLVILDVMFPGDSSAGFALARVMRHHETALKHVPILMLTAINSRFPLGFSARDIDEAWLPVTDFMEKPFDFDALQVKVSSLLTRAPTSGNGNRAR